MLVATTRDFTQRSDVIPSAYPCLPRTLRMKTRCGLLTTPRCASP